MTMTFLYVSPQLVSQSRLLFTHITVVQIQSLTGNDPQSVVNTHRATQYRCSTTPQISSSGIVEISAPGKYQDCTNKGVTTPWVHASHSTNHLSVIVVEQ